MNNTISKARTVQRPLLNLTVPLKIVVLRHSKLFFILFYRKIRLDISSE